MFIKDGSKDKRETRDKLSGISDFLEILTFSDGIVKDVAFKEVVCLAGAQVIVIIEF